MNTPLISIIIPVYNGSQYIHDCIENLENINYSNIEVIFINDGSTDDSLTILKKEIINNKHNQYILINQKNAGVSAARNRGIQSAKGEYITFVDVDDLIHPEILNVFLESLDKYENAVVFCDSSSRIYEDKIVNFKFDLFNRDEALKKFVLREIHTGVCGLMVRKDLILSNNLTFKVGFSYSEDLHMVIRIFNCVKTIIHIKAPLYNYKKNENSAMTKINANRLDSIYLMKDLEEYFKKHNENFAPFFLEYGVSRTAWAILWQFAHYLTFHEYLEFLKLYDFKKDMIALKKFPKLKVRISARIFLTSRTIYFYLVKLITIRYRKS
jgi:glycosyltransferase involved in cell wall biosynthesis